MKTPIHLVLRRISRLPAKHKQAHLRGLIDAEPPRSVRRQELEAAARDVITRQLKRERRA